MLRIRRARRLISMVLVPGMVLVGMWGGRPARLGAAARLAPVEADPPQEVAPSERATPPAAPDDPDAATTAVLPVAVDGEMSDTDRDLLTAKLVEGLTRGRFRTIPPSEMEPHVPRGTPCDAAACIMAAAKKAGATHVVVARVTVRDRDYGVEVELWDGKAGARIARTREGCEICGIAEAADLVDTAAATLRTKLEALARGPSRLSVVSEPAGAVVRIDGEIAGTTPIERQLVPGKHVIRVSKEGHITLEREVDLVEGTEESLRFSLERVPSRLPKRPWGYASLFVGIAALGTGVAFTALHDRPYKIGSNCKGDNIDRRGNCKYLWDTKWYAMAGVLAGAALVTLGVAILVNTAKRRPKKNRTKVRGKGGRRAALGIGPGSVLVQGRF